MAHGAEFKEIAHCGGKFIVTVTTDANGRRGMSFAVYALPPGVAVAMIELGGMGQSWDPPPYPNCLPVFIGSDSDLRVLRRVGGAPTPAGIAREGREPHEPAPD